jgi:hypothetical protein
MPFLFSNPIACKCALTATLLFSSGQGVLQAQTLSGSSGAKPAFTPAKLDALLLSPIQRQNLEYVRSVGRSPNTAEQSTDQLLNQSVNLSNTLILSGVVTRSGNRSTVWVNDQPLYGQSGKLALRVHAEPGDAKKLDGQKPQALAKPGQTLDLKTQQTTDLLPPGSIKIIPPKTDSTIKSKQEQ